jgi:hypothetical protein
MENVILVIHLFLALAIIGLVLLQRSEGGGLGIGGGGGLGWPCDPTGRGQSFDAYDRNLCRVVFPHQFDSRRYGRPGYARPCFADRRAAKYTSGARCQRCTGQSFGCA